MKCLIVNADDFGLHSAVNHGIIEGYEKGCIRSTSFVAAGAAAEEAAELARKHSGLGVGIHLTLVAERPVLPPSEVPSLLGENGRLLPDHMAFIRRYMTGGVRREELYAECEAQILRAREMGVRLSHIDSHQHLHVLPGVVKVVLSLAKKYGFTKMRLPAEPFLFTGGYPTSAGRYMAKCGLTSCARMAKSAIRSAGIVTPDSFFGMLAGGHLYTPHFLSILRALPDGVSEIMVHPGKDNRVLDDIYHWAYHWEEELASVTSAEAMKMIDERQIRLISYGELMDGEIL